MPGAPPSHGPLPDGRFGRWWARNPGVPLPLPWAVRFRRIYLRTEPEPHRVLAHRHLELELLLIRSGRWEGRIDGCDLAVPSGGALLVAPGDRHEDRCLRPVGLIGIMLELLPGPRPGWSASPLAPDAALADRALPEATALHQAGERLEAATLNGGNWTTHLQDAICHELVVRLLHALPPTAIAVEAGERVAAAELGHGLAACFERDPGGLSIPALAHEMGLSERVLQQRCRQLLGATPAQLQRRHRLALARELLLGGHQVQTVADQLGFANPFHFSTAFKRHFGYPPSRLADDLRD
ncbi:MAG: helix-turn-helix transcriptional regulator [Planctomycetota bacterium]|jgi:AraC-like DNA-binding protein|nr:helix-turn-helix transcriptional regulator [Planctomycetota bacterium]